MPRDNNGNYTLPAGNPVVSNTSIDVSWANPTLADIANELTNSLSRNGEGGMLVPFLNADGSVGQPGISWLSQPNTGFYMAGTSDMRVSIAGVQVARWIAGNYQLWDGAEWRDVAKSTADYDVNEVIEDAFNSNVGKEVVDLFEGDLNDIILTGFIVSGLTATNGPVAEIGTVTTVVNDVDNLSQTFVQLSNGEEWIRTKAVGVWGGWASNFQSLTRTNDEANTILDNADAGNIGKDSLPDDVNITAIDKAGFYRSSLGTGGPTGAGAGNWIRAPGVNANNGFELWASNAQAAPLYFRVEQGGGFGSWQKVTGVYVDSTPPLIDGLVKVTT